MMKYKVSPVYVEMKKAIESGADNIVQEGTTRSTKTWTNFQIIHEQALTKPMLVINVIRETAVSCRKILETEFERWLRDPMARMVEAKRGLITMKEATLLMKKESLIGQYKRNLSNHTWTAKKTGSVISFEGADDINKIMGMASDIVWLNEPYGIPKEVYDQLSQRTEMFILCDWNPMLSHWLDDVKKKPTTYFVFSTWKQNPFLGNRQKREILKHQMVSQSYLVENGFISESEAFKYDFTNNPKGFEKRHLAELSRTIQNQTTSNYIEDSKWHWQVFGLGQKAERPNRIFKWEEIPLHEYYAIESPIYYGNDWGEVDPWGIVEVKYMDGKLFVHELNYKNENTHISENESIMHAINQEGGMVTKLFRDIDVKKNRPIVCDSNYPLKIKTLRRYGWDYALGAKKPPGSIVGGISVMKKLEIYFTNTSGNIRNEQELYSWAKNRKGENLNEAEDANNHLMDAIRYVVNFLVEQGIIKIV